MIEAQMVPPIDDTKAALSDGDVHAVAFVDDPSYQPEYVLCHAPSVLHGRRRRSPCERAAACDS